MPGAYGKPVPLSQRTVGNLWFGIAWCSGIGLSFLLLGLPVLLPWQHLTPAALLLLVIVVGVEVSIGREVWKLAAELQRRSRG